MTDSHNITFPDTQHTRSSEEKAPQERSRFCKNRSKGFGDKFPQQAKSGSKPPCLPSVKPAGFARRQAAKRALFALLAASFCDPPGGASKAGLSPNKFLKISVLSGKMTVYKDSHQKGIEAINQNKEGGFYT